MQNINTKLEYWKSRLLDLGKRNRMINCPLPKEGSRVQRHSLLISEAATLNLLNESSAVSLWNTLVGNDGVVSFPIPSVYSAKEQHDTNGGFDTISVKHEDDTTEKTYVFPNGIQTNQITTEAHKTLRMLMKKAREFTEEKGLNALHLAFGFLNWVENGTEGQEMRSPLLLVPVKLTQEDLFSPIILSRTDDEISTNHSLSQKLLNDFGIELPVYSEEIELLEYIESVEKVVSSLNWTISNDLTLLSMFSFMKLNMYLDIEKNADIIANHQIVRVLNGEVLRDGVDTSDIGTYNHDDTEPQAVFSVVDSDSSQQDAVLLAKRGASFVLQGPPGTGKSQTITNMIAELIADGKKVLFVSEKMAALEVVHKRLTNVGLAPFCLTLHSHNAKRRDILEQLHKTIQMSRQRADLQQNAYDALYRLKNVRESLNEYSVQLHTRVEPLGKTIYQVTGELSKYGNYRDIDFIQVGAENFTPSLLSNSITALEDITRIVAISNYQEDNPWNGCILTQTPTHEFRQRFIVDSERFLALLHEGLGLFDVANKILGSNTSWGLFDVARICDIYDFAKASPEVPFSWVSLNAHEVIEIIDYTVDAMNKRDSIEKFYANNVEDFSDVKNKVKTRQAVESTNNTILHLLEEYNGKNTQLNDATAIFNEFLIFPEQLRKMVVSEVSLNSIMSDDFTLEPCVVSAYNTALDKNTSLVSKKLDIETAQNLAVSKLAESEALLTTAQDVASDRKSIWEIAETAISQTYDIKLLELDLQAILQRYRTIYRSKFSRIIGQYNKDKNAILAHCKTPSKLSYEEGLAFLGIAVDALSAKTEYESQMTVLKEAESQHKDCKNTWGSLSEQLEAVTKELSDADTQLQAEKQNIESVLKKSELSHRNTCLSAQSALDNTISNLLAEMQQAEDTMRTELKSSEALVNLQYEKLIGLLGMGIDNQTDYSRLKTDLLWCDSIIRLSKENRLGTEFIKKACSKDATLISAMTESSQRLDVWRNSTMPYFEKFSGFFEQECGLDKFNIRQLIEFLQRYSENFASLEYLIDYRIAEKRLMDLGIDSYLKKAKGLGLSAEEIVPIFLKCFSRSWLDAVIPKFSSVNDFRRLRQDERVEQFQDLDKKHLEISKALVFTKLISRLPNFDAFSANGEIALLRREMAKQRKLMPTRLLIKELPNLLPALKPCVMMSPLSISTYLGSSNYEFDVVIFDEASQVRTEDAIGAIFRAKQVIIAGDSKQLPPTDFFASSVSSSDEYEEDEDGEVNDAGAYESLLEEASMLPSQSLLWHYRSRHEHLIAFSNAKIYQNTLTTFPSASEKIEGMGVEYIHVRGGTYDKGGKNGNRLEAERIAELVFEHFEVSPERSLGIIAFGKVQEAAITEAIENKRRKNQSFESFFKEGEEESLFVKNLETVQGDERDTIIFSIGYAPDVSGKFTMNFGPLSRNGGERRLNVAVTRARYNLKLVGSILPTDITADRISSLGPKLLRQYIDFAINGESAILGELSVSDDLQFDSPFEVSVHEFLTKHGYDVATQIGCSGYRIDMAVKHPKYNGRFAIGIECDGAMYHSARTARERDRLRQTVLEDMGWNIYRIWSTDWIKDRHTEGERLLQAVKSAIEGYNEIMPKTYQLPAKASDFLDVKTQSAYESEREGVQQKYDAVRSRYKGYQVKEIPIKDIALTMLKVIEANFGLDKLGIFKETALFGYGWQRQGSAIKAKFEQTFNAMLEQNIIVEDSDGKIKIAKSSNS